MFHVCRFWSRDELQFQTFFLQLLTWAVGYVQLEVLAHSMSTISSFGQSAPVTRIGVLLPEATTPYLFEYDMTETSRISSVNLGRCSRQSILASTIAPTWHRPWNAPPPCAWRRPGAGGRSAGFRSRQGRRWRGDQEAPWSGDLAGDERMGDETGWKIGIFSHFLHILFWGMKIHLNWF